MALTLMRINEVVDRFGISSRTLRYYEQVGILWSSHPDCKTQRYYDDAALERLKQVIVLRKMQIPIKDILVIFQSESMASLIQAFVDKLSSLDGEISALSELRRVVDEFLHKMLIRGVKKISAIPLLYEETEKRLAMAGEPETVTYEKLAQISREALRLRDVRIIRLPPSRVLTSRLKSGGMASLDAGKMQTLFADYGLLPGPGLRDCFYQKMPDDEWMMLMRIPENFENHTLYEDARFPGGLYAVASSFMEDMDDTLALLRDWVGKNDSFESDTPSRGEFIEEILPWDIAEMLNRYQQDLFIPIRTKAKEDEANGASGNG